MLHIKIQTCLTIRLHFLKPYVIFRQIWKRLKNIIFSYWFEIASASRKEKRSVIRFFAIQCESTAKIHKKLVDVTYGVMPYAVQRFELGKKFEEGRASVPDLPRAGRPKTIVTATNAAHVEEMVMANRRISIKEISERLNISSGSVHTIIHDNYLLPVSVIDQRSHEKARGRFLLQQDNALPHRVPSW